MSDTIRMIAREDNGNVLVKLVISHPNESGARKDEQGRLVPAHFLKTGTVLLNGQALLDLQLGPSVSKDPFLQFRFEGRKGDVLNVSFIDSRNEQFAGETVVV
ncbi:MAG: thiosulfate oxidation carrier complex protein SoxZ [Chlorobiaceae bacterium]|nr:thiosulfate oxidation carrier complex protein SoxZ [Chlorobiaceae bacterium]NTW10335.1 thiosulfate oxidation carrier complex protein SoxZ [Chlorobiaceae bacterium]